MVIVMREMESVIGEPDMNTKHCRMRMIIGRVQSQMRTRD
jgi:hypothetical protein